MPKALVTGATGLLGRAIFKAFKDAGWDVVGTGLSRASRPGMVKLDLQDTAAIKQLVEKERPQLIIHSAADRSPDSVAANPTRARAINVDATRTLASTCVSLGIPIVYISTDYVFPGVPGEAPYAESATPQPTNLYGKLKLDGERAVLEEAEGKDVARTGLGCVLRVPVLYGPVEENDGGNKESAVNVLVDKVREASQGKEVVMDDWARRFPTCTEDIGQTIVQIGEKWLDRLSGNEEGAEMEEQRGGWPTVLHLSAGECYTKYEMCKVFADILNLDIRSMKADREGGGGGGVPRPYDTQLETSELEKLLGHGLRTIHFKEWWARNLRSL